MSHILLIPTYVYFWCPNKTLGLLMLRLGMTIEVSTGEMPIPLLIWRTFLLAQEHSFSKETTVCVVGPLTLWMYIVESFAPHTTHTILQIPTESCHLPFCPKSFSSGSGSMVFSDVTFSFILCIVIQIGYPKVSLAFSGGSIPC